MHNSAMKRMEWFVNNYIVPKAKAMAENDEVLKVMDLGSYNVNGSYKQMVTAIGHIDYVGVDVVPGPNVDVVLENPYSWPDQFLFGRFDFIISGNAFEHIRFPWRTMEQIKLTLKQGGITCILTPFSLGEHKYPTDCYRYFPDGMIALAEYAGLDIISCTTGGVPEHSLPNSWAMENYDDTVLIAGKHLTLGQINTLPRFKSEIRTKIWKGEI